jgi:hypothetical protein
VKKIETRKCKLCTLTLDLHAIYTIINTYTHNTGWNHVIILVGLFGQVWFILNQIFAPEDKV